MSTTTDTQWMPARELRTGDAVQAPDGGGSSRVRFGSEADARASSARFLRIETLERTGPDFPIPNGRCEVHVTLEDGSFRRWPEDARLLVRRG